MEMINIKNIRLNKKAVVLTIISIVLIAFIAYSCIKLFPLIMSLQNEKNLIEFKEYVQNLKLNGILLFLIIQILQIFIAIIPGELVELLAGLLYGTWGGLILCLIGNAIASFLIYLVVRLFAKSFTIKFQEKLATYNFLNNKKKILLYLFLIYLIPGLPKDILTYLVPFLPVSYTQFIIVTSIARIPSIISSTYSSYSILEQNYLIAIIVIALFSIIAIVGFIFRDNIISFIKKDSEKDKIADEKKEWKNGANIKYKSIWIQYFFRC